MAEKSSSKASTKGGAPKSDQDQNQSEQPQTAEERADAQAEQRERTNQESRSPAGQAEQRQEGQTPVAGEFNSGPGTGTDAPQDKQQGRYPSTVVNEPSAPLDPPKDTQTQTDPPQGYNLSSTDDVYGETGKRTVAGEDHVGLVTEDGSSVSADSLFDQNEGQTFATVNQRVYEEFLYPGTTTVARRLMFTEGQRIPLQMVARVKAAVENAPEPAQQRSAAGSGPDEENLDEKRAEQEQAEQAQSKAAAKQG